MDGTDRAEGARRPRRAPQSEERGRTAARTREKILTAAVAEFGAKGYAGARTAGIAARAGVNQQLIAYHFGGKQGVLDELRRRWTAIQAGLVESGDSFAASLTAHLHATLDHPDWARLVIWRALGDDPGQDDQADEAQREHLRGGVERVRDRQRAGELTDEVSAEFVTLLAHAITFAPIALPHIVRGALGIDPYSSRYRELCRDQLLTLLRPQRTEAASRESPTPASSAAASSPGHDT